MRRHDINCSFDPYAGPISQALGTAVQRDYPAYTYTQNGKLWEQIDARGNKTTLEYDGFDRLAKMRMPGTTVQGNPSSTTDYETYGYDANDNRVSWRKRSGDVFGFTFDALNREVTKDVPNTTAEDVTTDYDLLGRVLSRLYTATGTGVVNTYDAPGRLLTETTASKTMTYAYTDKVNVTPSISPQKFNNVEAGSRNPISALNGKHPAIADNARASAASRASLGAPPGGHSRVGGAARAPWALRFKQYNYRS